MPSARAARLLAAAALLLAALASLVGLAIASLDAERLQRGLDDRLSGLGLPALRADGPPALRFTPRPTLVLREVRLEGTGGLRLEADTLSLAVRLLPWWLDEQVQPERLSLRGLRLTLRLPAGADPADPATLAGLLPGLPALPWPALALEDLDLALQDAQGQDLGGLTVERLEGDALAAGQSGAWQGRLILRGGSPAAPRATLDLDARLAADAGERPALRAARVTLDGPLEPGAAQAPLRLRLQAEGLRLGLDGGPWSFDRAQLGAERPGPARPERLELRLGPGLWDGRAGGMAQFERLALELDAAAGAEGRLEASLELPRLGLTPDRLEGAPLRGSVRLSRPGQAWQGLLEAGAPGGTLARPTLPDLHLAWTGQGGGWTAVARADASLTGGRGARSAPAAPRPDRAGGAAPAASPWTLRTEDLRLRARLEAADAGHRLDLEAAGRLQADAAGVRAQLQGRLQDAAWQARLEGPRAADGPRLRGELSLARLDPAGLQALAALGMALPPSWASARLALALDAVELATGPLRQLRGEAWLDGERWGGEGLQAQAAGGRLLGRLEGLRQPDGLQALELRGEGLAAPDWLVALGQPATLEGRGRLEARLRRDGPGHPWAGHLAWRQGAGRWTGGTLTAAAPGEPARPAPGSTAFDSLGLDVRWPGPTLALHAQGRGWDAAAQGVAGAAGWRLDGRLTPRGQQAGRAALPREGLSLGLDLPAARPAPPAAAEGLRTPGPDAAPPPARR